MAEAADRSIASVLLSVIKNVELIVRSEIQLAMQETRGELFKASHATKFLGAGAILAILATAFLLLSCVYLLATVMAIWIAALVVALITGVIAGVLIFNGLTKLKLIRPAPEKAIASVKENIAWAKAQTR